MEAQQLRQRGAKGSADPAVDHSHSDSDSEDEARLFEAAHADAEPLVPAARSAFDGPERDSASASESSAAASAASGTSAAAAAAPADLPGPAAQSMDDDGDSDAGALELDTSAAAPAAAGATNGSRLNLPPQLRAAFEQRRAELLAQHPDILVSTPRQTDGGRPQRRRRTASHRELTQPGDLRAGRGPMHRLRSLVCIALHFPVTAVGGCFQTRELSGEIAEPGSDSLWSLCPRFDVVVMAALVGLLCWVLHSEYGIDVAGWFARLLRGMLDPGPIQHAQAQAGADLEPSDGDFAQGRAAMAAAVKAAREGLARQGHK